MAPHDWEPQLASLLEQSRELLASFRRRYPRLTEEQLVQIAVEWYMRAVLNHGMDPMTFEPNLVPVESEEDEEDWW